MPAGSLFAFVGPNGAGKTTTIKVLLNLLRPTSEEAFVLGVYFRRIGRRELARIGYVSENQELPDWMTVDQLIETCGRLSEWTTRYAASCGEISI